MKMSATTVRRGLYGMFAGGLLAFGSAAIVTPVVNAQPAPSQDTSCSVSAIATTSSTVSASTSSYLASNPEANEALTQIATQPQEQATEAFRAYFAQNPQVESELKAINQPVTEISSQCGVELTPTPISAALTDA
ncbi:hemophore-related protein, Rv0203/Rv1174c family [Mycolicibacterium rutilum]|uniref:Hemophore-related protein, Rv0203/Rv1174c family n=1 Tax=Mycolicibacterium rutilum TaxID=370526 RepID=A0A1H6JRQ9_MYCRU|nr:hemophore-related protein [Mycolicibacterium rutilum]SEH61998.1 hemophore-related protein, Rv0203/Rv1174c family [Mycolicibacterium rutilum]